MECKVITEKLFVDHCRVLIETLWNVKLIQLANPILYIFVLIETLWNVKVDERISAFSEEVVLIETLWNVKDINISTINALVAF